MGHGYGFIIYRDKVNILFLFIKYNWYVQLSAHLDKIVVIM